MTNFTRFAAMFVFVTLIGVVGCGRFGEDDFNNTPDAAVHKVDTGIRVDVTPVASPDTVVRADAMVGADIAPQTDTTPSDKDTTPPTLNIDVPTVQITSTTATIVVSYSEPIKYKLSVYGPVYSNPNGETVEGNTFNISFLTFALPETGLHPDTGYIVFLWAEDAAGNNAATHISFKTLPQTQDDAGVEAGVIPATTDALPSTDAEDPAVCNGVAAWAPHAPQSSSNSFGTQKTVAEVTLTVRADASDYINVGKLSFLAYTSNNVNVGNYHIYDELTRVCGEAQVSTVNANGSYTIDFTCDSSSDIWLVPGQTKIIRLVADVFGSLSPPPAIFHKFTKVGDYCGIDNGTTIHFY